MTATPSTDLSRRVLVTGGSGFVGRAVVRELLRRGWTPVCVVRDRRRAERITAVDPRAVEWVEGDLLEGTAWRTAVAGTAAAIHLVGIIAEDPRRGQTFPRVHVEATRHLLAACRAGGVERFVHMSALGARPDAASDYHRTKHAAENLVRRSGLRWTIFRPSVIHGPDGEFMRLMRKLTCDLLPPFMPHFGDGMARLQPVAVEDVAFCFVEALDRPQTVGQTYDLGGPEAMTWRELYRICREVLPGARRWKPVLGQPVPLAKLLAATVMRTDLVPAAWRFNRDQVVMSQEDSVCDIRPVEEAFGIRLRPFRPMLESYASRLG